jgi:AraC-type DNA-binding domain-containing proteins
MDYNTVSNRLKVFRELLSSIGNISIAELDSKYNCIGDSIQHQDVFSLFFQFSGTRLQSTAAFEDANDSGIKELKGPCVLTNTLGMTWLTDLDIHDGKIERICLLGPVFLDDYSVQQIENNIISLGLSVAVSQHFMKIIREMPIISLNRLYEYGIMLHRCLTGKVITIGDFIYPDLQTSVNEDEMIQERYGTYIAEQEILRIVEEGNINYEKIKSRYTLFGNTEQPAYTDYLRQAKNTVIIFCTLCSRVAIRGGLSSEIAYQLFHQYIAMAENAETLAKVNEINRAMFDDFVRRVYRVKNSQSDISPQIRKICDYSSLHLYDKLDIQSLASQLDYTDYYFSNKFKKETGLGVREYITRQRIEKAKELLTTTNLDIHIIGVRLGFSSQSHFGEVFRVRTGVSPGKYRSNFTEGERNP